ncbi:peptidase inhibitor family I36 protein [Streptomyces sp. NPDC002225]|uniref:peptidase inhibitor family I36 protein n=1 Tax=Streptomyces sp. NPDC002225 TaxID=3154413 RepID=UPI00331D0B38
MFRQSKLGLAAASSLLALAGTLVTGTGTANATAQAWGGCAAGDICVYSGLNGTGSVCAWDGDDNDWESGAITCSWSSTKKVMSIWNNGTGGPGSYKDVHFFHQANRLGWYGCAAQGWAGNTNGTTGAWLRSHQWWTGC